MCGFVGFTGKQSNNKVIKNMNDTIKHRGPDGEGYFIDDSISIGHRRLAIIDIEGGHQPMLSEDKKIVVAFNGEIYNFLTLRKELEQLGHIFQSHHSDTEVLIHGYEQWGESLLQKLRGMFAFVIWDSQNKKIFAARDHFGIKPFYYYITSNGDILFGSEIKSFMCHPSFKKELNVEQLELYLSFQYSPAEQTFFKGVKKLMPAHSLSWEDGDVSINRYWTPVLDDSVKDIDAHSVYANIEDIIKDSVEHHKISDVEIGSYLSSGIDSSYITKISGVSKTFSIGYEQEQYDESRFAKEFSNSLGIDNYIKYIDSSEYWENVDKVQYYMDEPLADASAISLYLLNREASKQVKVCFSGEGADEMFGGYNSYTDAFNHMWYNRIPTFMRKALAKGTSILPSGYGVNFLRRNAQSIDQRYFGPSMIFSKHQIRRILKVKGNSQIPQNFSKPYFKKSKHLTLASRMQLVDINLWLVGDILLKCDKMSMANSLEVRVPFLDKEVFDVASKLDSSYKFNSKSTKKALRHVARRSIDTTTANKKKLGFPVPMRDWLKNPDFNKNVRDIFESSYARDFFHQAELIKMIDSHQNGKSDNWRQIWCVYSFLIWYKIYFLSTFE